MATRFNVISLGTQSDLDTREGNSTAEGASELVGLTFGSGDDPLLHHVQEFSPGSTGYSGGDFSAYDLDNSPSETFRIDDGPEQTFDGVAAYWATLTYTDGTTSSISAVIFQDTDGNTYLAPEFTANRDQRALEAKPIESLTLNSVAQSRGISGLAADRQTTDFMVCFASGTMLAAAVGPVAVENLKIGDTLLTQDNGPQSIRWIGKRTVAWPDKSRPIVIRSGALGGGLPERDLLVSPQHRILARSKLVERMFGTEEILVAAKKLVGLPGISVSGPLAQVTYYHVLCESHEIVIANGAPAETLLLGPQACATIGTSAIDAIVARYPAMASRVRSDTPVRVIPSPKKQKEFARRLLKNSKPVMEFPASDTDALSGRALAA